MQADTIPIALRELDGRIELRSPSAVRKITVNTPAAGPYDLRIQPGSLRGANVLRPRVAYIYVPGGRRLEPTPARYYYLSGNMPLRGTDEVGLYFFPVELAKDYGSGTYLCFLEPCLSTGRTRSPYEVCREDRRERLALEILGDPKIDFVFRSTTQPRGSNRNFNFQVHGSELGDAKDTRVKMSPRSVSSAPRIGSGSTATLLEVQTGLRGTAACGPHHLTVNRYSPDADVWRVASHILNLHRGAGDNVVFEAVVGEVGGGLEIRSSGQTTPGFVPSNGRLVAPVSNLSTGSVAWQLRVPQPNPGPGFRIFLRARSPCGSNPIGVEGTLEEGDPNAASGWKTSRTFQWTVDARSAYGVRLLNLDGTTSAASI